jgi:hypothetical protein
LLANHWQFSLKKWLRNAIHSAGITVAAIFCSSLLAQEKTGMPANTTVINVLQANAGKTVEGKTGSNRVSQDPVEVFGLSWAPAKQ